VTKKRLVGVFDSGVGGLTVVKEILAKIQGIDIVYFGDTARAPYGNRSKEELIEFGQQSISFLINQGAEIIVVACNTSSANALPALYKRFDLPLIGTIEAGASLAIKMTVNGKIGMIGTERTVLSNAFGQAIDEALAKGVYPEKREARDALLDGNLQVSLVKAQACPLFVPLVEAGLAGSVEAEEIAKNYLLSLKEAGVDTIILGCTHYPYLNPITKKIMGSGVRLADPALEMVDKLKLALEQLEKNESDKVSIPREDCREIENSLNTEVGCFENSRDLNQVTYYVSGDPGLFCRVGNSLMENSINLKDIIQQDLSAK